MRQNADGAGCLLIGETKRMRVLGDMLNERGIRAVRTAVEGDLLCAVQEGLCAVRGKGGACIAAEGEMWVPALALAAQLCVERIVLIAPTDRATSALSESEKQLERLKSFVRRNLFFCVTEVLVLEESMDEKSARRIDRLFRRMCNSKVCRISLSDQRWTNCEHSPEEVAVRFLGGGDIKFSLA